MNTKVNHEWQIALPENFIRQLGLCEGSLLECRVEGGELRLRPISCLKKEEQQIRYKPVEGKLRIQCFGKMSVSIDGKHFIFKSKKAKELLAYLLCNKGEPVKNTVLAEILWQDIRKKNAMDNLYKAIHALKNMRLDNYTIPILMEHGESYLDQTAYSCDLTDFEQLYQMKYDIAKCAASVELYQGPLLYDEAYDWIALYEAYFDIRFLEMIDLLISHYKSNGNTRMENYYIFRSKVGFSE